MLSNGSDDHLQVQPLALKGHLTGKCSRPLIIIFELNIERRLQMFNLLAGSLAKIRKLNKKNAIHAEGTEEQQAAARCCWEKITHYFTRSPPSLPLFSALFRPGHWVRDLENLPYLSYFLLELSLLITGSIRKEMGSKELILFHKMQSMPAAEKNRIRERGEGYIGVRAELTNRGILRSIRDVICGVRSDSLA